MEDNFYMPSELYELKTELQRCKTGAEFVKWCYENGNKNTMHYGYMAGVLDALYWSGQITQRFYTEILSGLGM